MELSDYAAAGMIPKQGDIISGTIAISDHDGLLIQPLLATPCDVLVPKADLRRYFEPMALGDVVDVYITDIESEAEDATKGFTVGSISKARDEQLSRALAEIGPSLVDTQISVKVLRVIHNGRTGKPAGITGSTELPDLGTVEVFIPLSGLPPQNGSRDPEAFVGDTIQAVVLPNANAEGDKQVNLTAKSPLAWSPAVQRTAAHTIKRGDTVEGKVRYIANGGIEVILLNHNGARGFIPNSQMPPGKKDATKIGDYLKGIVFEIRHDPQQTPFRRWKILLSLHKKLVWNTFSRKTKEGQIMFAKVARLTNLGVLVAPEGWPDITGLIKKDNVKRPLNVGDNILVIRQTVIPERRMAWFTM